MKKFSYEITIEAADEKEADNKMKALTTMAKKLTAKELLAMEHMLLHDPIKTAIAKNALGV